jgi:2-amino-4-hydroxy-6-hydroxymethyldihydropteridine diphosphokinase
MHNAWLLLGSNIDPAHNLPRAAQCIAERTTLKAFSSVWQSPPADQSDQADYWNAALLVETEYSPDELLRCVIQPIEIDFGRERTENKSAPRSIDIDLMLFDSIVGTYAGKQLPHPDILLQAYAAVPLAEISPDMLHPTLGLSMREIANHSPNRSALLPCEVDLMGK